VILHDISWPDYEALLAMRGESSGTRIAYLEGELELMTPSFDHETLKTLLARLIEAYADECDIDLLGCGSWTLRKEADARGLEPDECYAIGPLATAPAIPDLAVEVIWTHGGLDKLSIYEGLGLPEIWFWQDGRLVFHLFDGQRYQTAPRSRLWPDFDPALIERLVGYPSQTQAVRDLRRALRESGAGSGEVAKD
jgi:Uma2 family endonuclease